MPEPRGTLELTWTNKHLAWLSDEDGGYEWVEPTDHRVSEVRLLKDAGTVGKTHADSSRAKDNLLIRGDALNALTSLAKLPEFAEEYRGKVKLVYIDPPFNTGKAFTHYDDNLEHSVWLTIPFPFGSYNTDWAVLVDTDEAEHLYFVVATKSSLFEGDLREAETAGIKCGEAHFATLAGMSESPAKFVMATNLDEVLASPRV